MRVSKVSAKQNPRGQEMKGHTKKTHTNKQKMHLSAVEQKSFRWPKQIYTHKYIDSGMTFEIVGLEQ